jgi:hypothetical protein
MKIHETVRPDGSLAATHVVCGPLAIVDDDGTWPLPDGAIEAVMRRFGGELEPHEPLIDIDVLDLAGARLRHVRHRARYDVIARDFLVYEPESGPPRIALATTVAGALTHLARRSAARSPP